MADTTAAFRVLETSHPPTIYIPRDDIPAQLRPSGTRTVCEFKGRAVYWDLVAADRVVEDAAWSYPDPAAGYDQIRGPLAFYPGKVDEAWLGDDRVSPQEGSFYGGWITPEIVGPFKGGPGTAAW